MLKKTIYNPQKVLIQVILLLGVVIPFIQFLDNRSLWTDEAKLALNIITKSAIELFKPLDHNQVAPILFLQVEKVFSILSPHSEFGLRLFPLLCFYGSLFFFYRILKIIFKDNYHLIIIALLLFVCNSNMVYYSSEVKQYMTDVFVVTAIMYFTIKDFIKPSNKFVGLGVVGAISIYFSNISPIILFAAGAYVFYHTVIVEKKRLPSVLLLFGTWLVLFFSYYMLFIHGHPMKDHLVSSMSRKAAFPAQDVFSPDFFHYFSSHVFITVFSGLMPFYLLRKIPLFILFLAGIFIMIRKGKADLFILLILPLITHLTLSYFHIYPFNLRFILYNIPLIILVISFGFDGLIVLIAYLFKKAITAKPVQLNYTYISVIFIPLLLVTGFYLKKLPIHREEIKQSLRYIHKHIDKDDKIYLYYGSGSAYKYYKTIGLYCFPDNEVIYGTSNRSRKDNYISELNYYSGRLWILFSHVYDDEKSYILNKLDSLGKKRLKKFIARGTAAYLYDFGN
jgi:hypothetical protein